MIEQLSHLPSDAETILKENPGSHNLFFHLTKRLLRDQSVVHPEFGGSVRFALSLYQLLHNMHAEAGCDERKPNCKGIL